MFAGRGIWERKRKWRSVFLFCCERKILTVSFFSFLSGHSDSFGKTNTMLTRAALPSRLALPAAPRPRASRGRPAVVVAGEFRRENARAERETRLLDLQERGGDSNRSGSSRCPSLSQSHARRTEHACRSLLFLSCSRRELVHDNNTLTFLKSSFASIQGCLAADLLLRKRQRKRQRRRRRRRPQMPLPKSALPRSSSSLLPPSTASRRGQQPPATAICLRPRSTGRPTTRTAPIRTSACRRRRCRCRRCRHRR